MNVYLCTLHVQCQQRSEEGIIFSETEVTDGYMISHRSDMQSPDEALSEHIKCR